MIVQGKKYSYKAHAVRVPKCLCPATPKMSADVIYNIFSLTAKKAFATSMVQVRLF